MKVCPTCDSTHFAGRYCYDCGSKLIAAPRCNWCGNEIAFRVKHCNGCGRTREEALGKSPSTKEWLLDLFRRNFGNEKNKKTNKPK